MVERESTQQNMISEVVFSVVCSVILVGCFLPFLSRVSSWATLAIKLASRVSDFPNDIPVVQSNCSSERHTLSKTFSTQSNSEYSTTKSKKLPHLKFDEFLHVFYHIKAPRYITVRTTLPPPSIDKQRWIWVAWWDSYHISIVVQVVKHQLSLRI